MVAITLSLSTPPISIHNFPSSTSTRPNQIFFRRRMLASAASSEDASTGANKYAGGIPVAESPSYETISYGEKFVAEVIVKEQAPPAEEDSPLPDFLLQNIKDVAGHSFSLYMLGLAVAHCVTMFDSRDAVPIVLYGSGALVAFWLASAVVGAIDSIPLFSKLMELVGLAYTLWFATRYLLFKEDREELIAKIEILKLEVLGFDDR